MQIAPAKLMGGSPRRIHSGASDVAKCKELWPVQMPSALVQRVGQPKHFPLGIHNVHDRGADPRISRVGGAALQED